MDAAQESTVGMVVRDFVDPDRPHWSGKGDRPLRTTIWYPAAPSGESQPVRIGPPAEPLFAAGDVVREGDLKEDAPRPLALLSHGTGGASLQLMWLAEQLVAEGYLVAGVDHHGNTAAEERLYPHGFLLWWERAQDLRLVLDRLLDDPEFGGLIDRDRIGAAGFSLGGYTVLTLAGAEVDLAAFEAFCSGPRRDVSCDAPPEYPGLFHDMEQIREEPSVEESLRRSARSYREPRVRGVFAMAPALGGAFTPAGLTEVAVPVRIISGDADEVTPLESNARTYADGIPGSELIVLPGVSHYTFLSVCTPAGERRLARFCEDPPGIRREEIHRQVGRHAIEFFTEVLGPGNP